MQQIDIHKAQEIIKSNNSTIIDIRQDEDYASSHVPDAMLVNQSNLDEFIKNTDKNKPLICYCYHGISSQQAADFFEDAGFVNVYSVVGGFEAWRQEYPVVSS